MSRKMIFVLSFLLSVFCAELLFAQFNTYDLYSVDKIKPVRETAWEKAMFPKNLIPMSDIELIAPEGDFTSEAEFEQFYGVLIQWPSFTQIDDPLMEYFTSMTLETAEVAKVFMVVSTEVEKEYYKAHLVDRGIDPDQLIFFIINVNDFWSRDFGPQYVFDKQGNATIIDLLYYPARYFDDMVPRYFESATNLPMYDLPLYFEGGNLMGDGVNTCSYNEGLYMSNANYSPEEIDTMMDDYCGCQRSIVLKMDNDYTFFHIDLAAKFLSENKVLIAQTDPKNRYYNYLEEVNRIFLESVDSNGNPYEIIRMPIKIPLLETPWGLLYVPKTYLNSLIINNKVLVPTFNEPEDEAALDIYRNAMPGYEVVGIDSTSIFIYGGAVHCTTKGIPSIPLSIGLSTDKNVYNIGENINVMISAHVPTESVTCDLYIKVRTPQGKILYFPDWNETKNKTLTGLILPRDLALYTIELFEWNPDPREKPISGIGSYDIQAYITKPGTDEIIGISHTAKIEVKELCPSGMINIPDSYIVMGSGNNYRVNLTEYCIDKFEYPNKYGMVPSNGYSWYEAETACKEAGKRLCTEAEWENACRGVSDYYDYPYGWFHKIGLCPDYAPGTQPSGSYTLCTGIHNVYDMSGNLWEWVSDLMGNYPK
ncbi:agmatine deiminase family protein, partial [bacterium]|nr:agmatine deiminase family protein [bacterium]